MDKFDFRTEFYFSGTARLVAGIFVPVGLLVLVAYTVPGIIMLGICLLVFTTQYRISFDLDEKSYHDYVWILGIKNGERIDFNSIEYLFIKKNRQTQTVGSRVQSSTFTTDVFDTFVRFSDDHKLHLFTESNKARSLAKLSKIALKLRVDIVDYTTPEPEVINVLINASISPINK